MPPKPKFKREEIVDAAYELARSRGYSALTARDVGNALGTSSSPIFTVFRDMEELRTEVVGKAQRKFEEYMSIAEDYSPAYKKRGLQWVKFAQDEPELFKILFMRPDTSHPDLSKASVMIPFGKSNDIRIIMRDYNATEEQAEHLFGQMWTYTYGLCVLCATGVCWFTEEETSDRLGEIFIGMVHVILHGDERRNARVVPLDSDEGRELVRLNPDFKKSESED